MGYTFTIITSGRTIKELVQPNQEVLGCLKKLTKVRTYSQVKLKNRSANPENDIMHYKITL